MGAGVGGGRGTYFASAAGAVLGRGDSHGGDGGGGGDTGALADRPTSTDCDGVDLVGPRLAPPWGRRLRNLAVGPGASIAGRTRRARKRDLRVESHAKFCHLRLFHGTFRLANSCISNSFPVLRGGGGLRKILTTTANIRHSCWWFSSRFDAIQYNKYTTRFIFMLIAFQVLPKSSSQVNNWCFAT